MLIPAKDPRPTSKTKDSTKFKSSNPGFDADKTYQLVAYGQPKKMKDSKTKKSFIRHNAEHWDSFNDKRIAIRVARGIVKMSTYSHVDVYGRDNTLIYQCHYNAKLRRVIAEEL